MELPGAIVDDRVHQPTSSPSGGVREFSQSSEPSTQEVPHRNSLQSEFYEGSSVEDLWQRDLQASYLSSGFMEASQLSPPYRLPKSPSNLYAEQIAPIIKAKPTSVVYEASKWQKSHESAALPFDRVLRKLPDGLDVDARGPATGPLGHPNEPVWFEMNHRLQAILRRQAGRAERRRRRRARSKLATGRTRGTAKRSEQRGLLESFERALGAPAAEPPGAAGELLGRVHETYLQRRDRWEVKRFQVRGTGGALVDKYGIGEDPPPRMGHVVRPVYVPPPGVRAEPAR